MTPDLMLFRVNEAALGQDVNGDGDLLDLPWFQRDGKRKETGPLGYAGDLGTKRFALERLEEWRLPADLNGDGDLDDGAQRRG